MGSCVSSLEGQQKEDVEEVKLDCNGNEKTRKENTPNANIIGLRGPFDFEFLRKTGGIIGEDDLHRISSRICLSGASASRVAFLYTKQGTRTKQKYVNQDAMLVWENFCSREDTNTIFFSVFDGHGPFGHLVSKKVRDSLPFKLFCLWKASMGDLDGPYAYASVLERMSFAETTSTSSDDEWSKPLDTNELNKLPKKHLKLKHSLLKAFKLMDEELKKMHPKIIALESGTTAVTLIKQGQDLVIGNVGDSRAVLGTRDIGNALVAIQLTVDLKPVLPREAARIKKHGGRVHVDKAGDVPRMFGKDADGGLAMSRAFGDFELKQYGLISVPEISYHQITQRDEFIIVATDGVWDVLSNKDAVDIVASTPSRGAAAKALVERALNQSSAHDRDDCTVICLFLDSCTTTSRGTAGWKSQTSVSDVSWVVEGSACTKDEKLLNRCQSTRSLANSISTTKEWSPLECATRMNSLQNLSSFGSHHENYINFR